MVYGRLSGRKKEQKAQSSNRFRRLIEIPHFLIYIFLTHLLTDPGRFPLYFYFFILISRTALNVSVVWNAVISSITF